MEEEAEAEWHNGWAVADEKGGFCFDHCAAKSISTSRRASLVLVRLAVWFLFPLAFERCANLPHALVFCVFVVSAGCIAGEWLQGAGFGYENVDILADGDDKLFAVRCAESVCSLDLLRVACVVFRVKQCINGIGPHDVGIGGCVIVVRGEYGWWVILAIHNGAEGLRDCTDVASETGGWRYGQ